MSATALVFLFPGQGAYFPGALQAAAQRYAVVDDTLKEIDTVARAELGCSVRDLLVDPGSPAPDELERTAPDSLDMAIYAASVCAYRVLETRGCEPSILVGHSLGEIAALVCGGAFTVTQGAAIVAARSLTLKPAAGSGYMAAIAASPRRCGAIIELLETPQANVAVDNGPDQTIMSGATVAMDRVATVAQALGIALSRLRSAYPFHSPQLVPVAKAFRTAIARHARKGTRVPIYSPILERVYEDKDDLAIALSSHLVRPVRFAATVRHLRQTSDSLVFVEIGASDHLTALVQRILNDPNIPAYSTLAANAQGSVLNATLAELRTRGLAQAEVDLALLQSLLPQPSTEAELSRFWQARGARILTKVAEEFVSFRRLDAEAPPPALSSPAIAHAASEVPDTGDQKPSHAITAQTVVPVQVSRSELLKEIVTAYARAMAYPPEIFTEHVALEAQLGIDKTRQLKLLRALEARYRLPPRPAGFAVSELTTVGKVADFILQAMRARSVRSPSAEIVVLPERENAKTHLSGVIVSQSTVSQRGEAAPAADAMDAVALPKGVPQAVTEERTARVADEVTCTMLPQAPDTIPTLTTALPTTRAALYEEIASMYADSLGYPPQMLREDAALDAELGIDSLKQMELLGQLATRYRLPPESAAFRLSDHGTLRKITDYIHRLIIVDLMHIDEHITAVPLPTVAPAFIPSEDEIERDRQARLANAARAGANLTRAALEIEIVALFAEAMEYPPEVFAEDIDLEGELGIDSVKQMELLSKLEMRYKLPARPESFRLTDYGTLRKITDFVHEAIASAGSERAQCVPVYAVG